MSIPSRIFIVPYRNRKEQKFFYSKQMSFILEGETDYEIFFVHQSDNRSFNRGATKNIGFLAMKDKYPNDYQNITFIFNDVDTLPFHKIFDYKTTPGIVKHYYGFEYALGGIVVVNGSDFEKINGYPNFWGWGMEDACLQKRCAKYGLEIDRSQFYKIGSPEILQLFDGVSRLICKKDPQRMQKDSGIDGLQTIHGLQYDIDTKSFNPSDNHFIVENDRIWIINVTHFVTHVRFESDEYYEYDLREPKTQFKHANKGRLQNPINTTEEWKHIPYYPTAEERKQQQQQIKQVVQPTINKYHPKYASVIGAKPAAMGSVRMGLGGVF
uniref:Galactosyltransferase C-terminal domain-containing protein n=1 Tax=viral metagenome TaxID=1070528 RepID=A0A6C0BAP1_9ZZZZ